MEPDNTLRPLSVPLPKSENENRVVGQATTAMSSIVFPDYEQINDEFVTKRQGVRPKADSPWSVLNKNQAEGKVKIQRKGKAMKDALSAIRQFTSDGNLSRNGNLNTTTMKEMWDYESQEPFSGRTKDVSEMVPEKSKNIQSIPKIGCELCGGNHEVDQCPT